MARTVAIGVQSFAELREGKYFYVDKTDFIREWWDGGDAVTLITRPRRFGKTLNMDMLDCFFSMKYAGRGEELFSGLSVWEDEGMRAQQGKWPVIFLSFAGVKQNTISLAKASICQVISDLYMGHDEILEAGRLSRREEDYFSRVDDNMDEAAASVSLKRLSALLEKTYGKKVLIFLDEYDAPMQEAYIHGYWEEMSQFMRVLFNNTFKTNRSLRRAVITGVTRITRESMFSDLNNLTVVSTTSNMYETAFGFTEKEVFEAMDEFGLPDRQEVKDWYDGFAFGEERDIYNPWSITNYLKNRKTGPYWANTSSNGLASRLIRQGGEELREQFETLMARDSGSDIAGAELSARGNASTNADINSNAHTNVNANDNANADNDTCDAACINTLENDDARVNPHGNVNARDDTLINARANVNAHAHNDAVINACADTCINARANDNARTNVNANANARANVCINVRANTHDYGYNVESADDVECREFSNGFGVIEARLDEQVVFSELSGNPDSVWSLLLAAGYLKVLSVEEGIYRLSLVNREVRMSFEKMVRQWFDGSDGSYNAFQRALLSGDVRRMNEYLQEVALSTVSVFDSGRGPSGKAPERFWHGLVLGLSIDLRDRYVIRSNRESGYGRYDVMMIPKMIMTGDGNRKGDLRHPSRPDGMPDARFSADPERKDAVEEQHIPGVLVPENSVETVKKGAEYNPKVRVPEKSVETGKRETEYISNARVPENSLETLTGLAGYTPNTRIPLSGLPGIIMEFKMLDETEGEKKLSDTAGAALWQIEEKHYEQELLSLGLPRERIRKYGFAFRGKETLILEAQKSGRILSN